MHQDAAIYASLLDKGEKVAHPLAAGRKAWLQVTSGGVVLNGKELRAGDGAAVENETALKITGQADSADILLFDLPA